ncbi:MAG: hypothetical protein WC389_17340 [Lutibacter sp.]|jgi:uncharacterized membrane protein
MNDEIISKVQDWLPVCVAIAVLIGVFIGFLSSDRKINIPLKSLIKSIVFFLGGLVMITGALIPPYNNVALSFGLGILGLFFVIGGIMNIKNRNKKDDKELKTTDEIS